ncbi:MAG: MMPL family transporter, partial [Myxococcota bacterium]|nr:MMPL family transporter [Myxococcota bacterium]
GFFSFGTAHLKSLAGLGILAGCGVLLAWFVSYFILGPLLFLLPSRIKPAPKDNMDARINLARPFVAKITRHRKPIILVFSFLTVGAALLTVNNDVNSDPYQYFAQGVPLRDANDFITNEVGGARGLEIVVRAGKEDGVKDPAFLEQVETFQTWLETRPEVTRTLSVVDILKATHRSLNGGDQAFYTLPKSRDMIGQELFLYTMSLPQGMDINDRITLKNDAIRVTVLWTLSDSKRWMDEAALVAQHAQEQGLDVTITGKGNIYQSMNPYVVDSFVRSISVALVLISILLVFVFGSFKMGMVALLPNCIPLLFGGAVFWLLGKSIDIGSVLVMSVCLGIAVDDTIHILSNYNRLIRDGLSPQEATAQVLAHTSPALIFTTIILVLGFGTLAFATFVPNIYFGIMTATILSLALFTDLTFLLAVLTRDEEPQKA